MTPFWDIFLGQKFIYSDSFICHDLFKKCKKFPNLFPNLFNVNTCINIKHTHINHIYKMVDFKLFGCQKTMIVLE